MREINDGPQHVYITNLHEAYLFKLYLFMVDLLGVVGRWIGEHSVQSFMVILCCYEILIRSLEDIGILHNDFHCCCTLI